IDSKGTFQTQRQVQVQLDEVYVSLRAQREEASGMVDRRLSQEREGTARKLILSMEFSVAAKNSLLEKIVEQDDLLSDTELSAEEVEDRLEQLYVHTKKGFPIEEKPTEVLELADVVSRHDKVVILGDPGSGKTTLLRYLA